MLDAAATMPSTAIDVGTLSATGSAAAVIGQPGPQQSQESC